MKPHHHSFSNSVKGVNKRDNINHGMMKPKYKEFPGDTALSNKNGYNMNTPDWDRSDIHQAQKNNLNDYPNHR